MRIFGQPARPGLRLWWILSICLNGIYAGLLGPVPGPAVPHGPLRPQGMAAC